MSDFSTRIPTHELGEILAWRDLYAAAPPAFADAVGLHATVIGGALVLRAAAIDIILFNRAFGITSETTAEDFDAIAEYYRAAGVRRYALQPGTDATLADVEAAAGRHGLRHTTNWAKVIRGTEPPPEVPCTLRIVEIGRSAADAFAQTTCTAFGMPDAIAPWTAAPIGRDGWRHYAACDGDRLVATGALFMHGEMGWLGLGSTLEEYRGRGAQQAIMARRVQDAIDAGCRWITTETGEDVPERSNPSFRNMIRTGFRVAHMRPNYIGPA